MSQALPRPSGLGQSLLTGPRRPLQRRGLNAQTAREGLILVVLFLCALFSILTTAGIVWVLLADSLPFFREVSLKEFLTDRQWTPLFADKHFGILPLMGGTLLTSAVAMAVALPLGLTVAVYLAEYASERVRAVIKPIIEILAGIPTIVFGYFALLFITPLLQRFIPDLQAFNALGPGIVLGFMILPTVASLSEDAIYAVPDGLRQGSYGLGATKWQTIRGVILPTAFSGISASFLLGISRAVGETMIVTIAAGQMPNLTADPRVPLMTMTAYIVQVSLGDTPHGTLEYYTIFAVGLMLFLSTLVLNLVSIWLRERYREVSE